MILPRLLQRDSADKMKMYAKYEMLPDKTGAWRDRWGGGGTDGEEEGQMERRRDRWGGGRADGEEEEGKKWMKKEDGEMQACSPTSKAENQRVD